MWGKVWEPLSSGVGFISKGERDGFQLKGNNTSKGLEIRTWPTGGEANL